MMKSRPKIIKRYQNRKLYDTLLSRYITLEDLAKMIKNGEDIVVVDNLTEKDITSNTLTQLILETEKKTKGLLPISTLSSFFSRRSQWKNPLPGPIFGMLIGSGFMVRSSSFGVQGKRYIPRPLSFHEL